LEIIKEESTAEYTPFHGYKRRIDIGHEFVLSAVKVMVYLNDIQEGSRDYLPCAIVVNE